MHGLSLILGKGLILSNPLSVIMTISPFSTSLINFAPIISKAHVAEAKTYDLLSLPTTSGRIPNGSLIPIKISICQNC